MGRPAYSRPYNRELVESVYTLQRASRRWGWLVLTLQARDDLRNVVEQMAWARLSLGVGPVNVVNWGQA